MEELPDLKQNVSDGVAAVVRATTGLLPSVGDILNELILPHIKNQWHDRITQFAWMLRDELSKIPADKIQRLLDHPSLMNIVEEGAQKSMRTYSDKRREEIARLIANSLKQEEVNAEVAIALIQMLAELNDTEVILLISKTKFATKEYHLTHEKIIHSGWIRSGATKEDHFNAMMYEKYMAHLVEINVLQPV